jgi:MacB-like protein
MHWLRFMEGFSRDLHHSARMLLKRRAFASIAVITLALGIGANTAIFSLVRSVLLRPLPFSESERLIGIRESKVGEGHNNPMAWRTFTEIRDKAQTIESVAAYVNSNPTIEQAEGTVSVQGARVSHSYFKVLGMHPAQPLDAVTHQRGLKQAYPATHSRDHGVYATSLKDYVVETDDLVGIVYLRARSKDSVWGRKVRG